MSDTQRKQVIDQLEEHGEVTRNWCLARYISRLSAIILNLKNEGWDLEGHWRKYDRGKDFVYSVVSKPKKTEHKIITKPDGSRVAKQLTL